MRREPGAGSTSDAPGQEVAMDRRLYRRTLTLLTGALLAAAVAAPTLAGGWASATLDDTGSGGSGGTTAGEETQVGFTLKQHGVTPINWEQATFVGQNPSTGETVRAQARPSGGPGHYVATVTFPSAGEWTWHLELRDLLYGLPNGAAGAQAGQTLTVAAAAAVPSSPAATGTDPLLIAAVGLLTFLAGVFIGSFRGVSRRPASEPVSTGELATH
jgi:hypothetical protein